MNATIETTSQNGPRTILRVARDSSGERVPGDMLHPPAFWAEARESLGGEAGAERGYRLAGSILDDRGGEPIEWEAPGWYREPSEAFHALKKGLADALGGLFLRALRTGDNEAAVVWRAHLYEATRAVEDAINVEDEREVITFTPLPADDEAQVLRLAADRFPELLRRACVAFRLRHSSIGEPWTAGVDTEGEPVARRFAVAKASAESAGYATLLNGFRPHFIITFCRSAWGREFGRSQLMLAHEALSLCLAEYNEKGKLVLRVASPTTLPSNAVLEEYADVLFPVHADAVESLLMGAVNHGVQLDAFRAMIGTEAANADPT